MDTKETRLRYAVEFLAAGGWISTSAADELLHYLERCYWAAEIPQEVWDSMYDWQFMELMAESYEAHDVWSEARRNVPRRLDGIVKLLDDAFLRV